MKVLILHGSARKAGNTGILAESFGRGAKDGGHEVEKIWLKEKNVGDCLGCCACQQNRGVCIQRDDMQELYGKIAEADVVALASPVYFYTWTSLMKKTLDRTYAMRANLQNTRFVLLTAGDGVEKDMDTIVDSYHKYLSYFEGENIVDGGCIIASRATSPQDTRSSKAAEDAYLLGRQL